MLLDDVCRSLSLFHSQVWKTRSGQTGAHEKKKSEGDIKESIWLWINSKWKRGSHAVKREMKRGWMDSSLVIINAVREQKFSRRRRKCYRIRKERWIIEKKRTSLPHAFLLYFGQMSQRNALSSLFQKTDLSDLPPLFRLRKGFFHFGLLLFFHHRVGKKLWTGHSVQETMNEKGRERERDLVTENSLLSLLLFLSGTKGLWWKREESTW